MKSSIDPTSGSDDFRRIRCGLVLAAVAILALAATSCSMLKRETQQTESVVQSMFGGKQSTDAAQRLALVQTIIMREADRYVAMVAQATDEFASRNGTPEARYAAQHWKLVQATGAYINATGENPVFNAVDMVILATVSRMVVEDYWVSAKFGAAAQPLLDTQRELETNAWIGAEEVLTPDQRKELSRMIAEWRAQNPHDRNVGAARFSDFVKSIHANAPAAPATGPASLLNLAMVNPLSGLDPAVRAIEQSRQLAARLTYYAERAPRLWSWQVELLTYQLADQPETRRVLNDVDRLAGSAQSFAKTAESLPKLVQQEREAAINQLLAGVAKERSNILATLNAQEAQLKELLPQVRQTLATGNDMAQSVKDAIQSLDAFVRYVSPPETNAAPASTNNPPFNVLDYGTAAGQIGAMAKDLNALLTSVNQNLPQAARLGQQASADAREVVNHAFRLGLVLIVVLAIVTVLAALAYRFLTRKLVRDARG
jgi:hypothetical protein